MKAFHRWGIGTFAFAVISSDASRFLTGSGRGDIPANLYLSGKTKSGFGPSDAAGAEWHTICLVFRGIHAIETLPGLNRGRPSCDDGQGDSRTSCQHLSR